MDKNMTAKVMTVKPVKEIPLTIPAKAPKIKAVKIKSAPEVIEADQDICDLYSGLINQQGEMEFIIEIASRLNRGATSVRIIQASIELASSMGNAPTIKKGHAQYIVTASKIIETQSGADTWPVAKLLKLATRLQRHAGVENIETALTITESVEELDQAVPVINTNKRGTKGTKITESAPVAKLRTVDEVIAVTFAGLQSLTKNPRDLKATDLKTLKAVSELLKVIADNSTPKK
jgi:hypothetical protein